MILKTERRILTMKSDESMKNICKIIWSDEALNNLKEILEYIEYRWTEKELNHFSKLLDNNLNLIQFNPKLFPKVDGYPNLRRNVISSQTSIYYEVFSNEIHLISLIDNRQNPDRLKIK